mgnify:CR=1 FL=1
MIITKYVVVFSFIVIIILSIYIYKNLKNDGDTCNVFTSKCNDGTDNPNISMFTEEEKQILSQNDDVCNLLRCGNTLSTTDNTNIKYILDTHEKQHFILPNKSTLYPDLIEDSRINSLSCGEFGKINKKKINNLTTELSCECGLTNQIQNGKLNGNCDYTCDTGYVKWYNKNLGNGIYNSNDTLFENLKEYSPVGWQSLNLPLDKNNNKIYPDPFLDELGKFSDQNEKSGYDQNNNPKCVIDSSLPFESNSKNVKKCEKPSTGYKNGYQFYKNNKWTNDCNNALSAVDCDNGYDYIPITNEFGRCIKNLEQISSNDRDCELGSWGYCSIACGLETDKGIKYRPINNQPKGNGKSCEQVALYMLDQISESDKKLFNFRIDNGKLAKDCAPFAECT